jgi:uncharacterized Zn finger protein
MGNPEGIYTMADDPNLGKELELAKPEMKGAGFYGEVKKTLQLKNKKELIDLLVELSERYPDVERFILERSPLDSGKTRKFVASLRSEIHNLTSEPVWSRHWSNECHLPDYSHLQQMFEDLAEGGYADELLELGEELWERGNSQLEESDDEGETSDAIGDCLKIVVSALPQSSLSKSEQLLWYIERKAVDEYGVLYDKDERLIKEGDYSESDWLEVATDLERRLASSEADGRSNLVDWLTRAYKASGQNDRVIPLYEREGDYVSLVEALLEAGRRKEARENCVLGYEKAVKTSSYNTKKLHACLRDMAEAEGRNDLAAAYRCDDFCGNPTVQNYIALRDSAEKAGCWPAVREAALRFLESGERADRPDADGKKKKTGAPWPLPPTEVAHLYENEKPDQKDFPKREPLVRVALLENRFDDAIELYRTLPKQRAWYGENVYDGLDKDLAIAVADTHPETSLSIWRTIVDSLIAVTKPAAYQEARPFMEHMKTLYKKNGRSGEWQKLISELRATHKLKRRLMEVLAAVE